MRLPWRKKNALSDLDRIKKSERHLKEYRNLPDTEKIPQYDILRKALFRINDVLNSCNAAYEKQEMLNGDVQLADIYLIPYADKDGKMAYISYMQALNLRYPMGEYEILDPATGKISQSGAERISIIIAVNYSLSRICERWLREIAEIEEAVKKAESD